MHYRLFVTINKDQANTSEEARQFVKSKLEGDPTFVGDGGRFTDPIADWFVIGGRWSGELAQQYIKKDFWGEIKKAKIGSEFGLSTQDVKDNAKKIQKIWETIGGKGVNPVARDSYNEEGLEDDAMIVDKILYDKILKEYEGKDEGFTEQEHNVYKWKDLHFVDLDSDIVDPKFIGNKWIVVVDYHS